MNNEKMISGDRIRVFISSACGGERIKFDRFVDNELKNKQDVVNKALVTNYDLVRRALKVAFDETGFIETYVFEDSPGSSSTAEEDFLYEIKNSDVCLFLIDNFGAIPNGVLKEIDRANSEKKKSIYIFLNDPNRNETDIQKTLIGANGPHFYFIQDIREFINKGFEFVISDILTTYRKYCMGLLQDTSEKQPPLVNIREENFPVEIVNIDEKVFNNLGLTKNKLVSLIHLPKSGNVQSSDFDKVCVSVLECLLGEKNFSDIDLTSLLRTLSEIQSPELHGMVCKRWDMISSFYHGDITTTIKKVETIYEEYSTSLIIPEWLLSDVLIDWRNLNSINGQINNVIDFSIQEKINKRELPLFFPLIDRFGKNISDDILERNFDLLTSSPYTKHFFNLEHLFGYISNYLFTAIYYGSYTHMVLTLNKIQEILFELVQKDGSLLDKVQIMRVSVLYGDENDFAKIMDIYKSSLSHSTAKEILDLYKLANTKPLSYQKVLWKIILFRDLGYYFSDADYETVFNEVLGLSYRWIYEEDQNIDLLDEFIKALKSNRERLSHDRIVRFAIDIFSKRYYRFFHNTFELINKLSFSDVSQELLSSLWLQVKTMLDKKDERLLDIDIEYFFVNLRENLNGYGAEIDALVEKYDPEFYRGRYHLAIVPEGRVSHIQTYLDSIKVRNAVQGKDGKYIGFVDNPYAIIKTIIKSDNASFSEDLLGSLLKEIANTLFSDTQTYNEKVDSLQLLLFLKKQEFARNYAWNDYYFELKQKKSIVEKGYSGFFDQGSSLLLRLHLTFLQIAFEEDCLQDILEILALINNGKNSEIIDSLRAVIDFLKSEKDNLVVSPVITVLVQYISVFCFHTNSDVRFWTVRALYQLIDTQYADFVIGRLSKMMDDDSFDVKWAIVEQALLIKQHNPATFSYIIGKAQIDNNYLVRISVKKHIEEMQHGGE